MASVASSSLAAYSLVLLLLLILRLSVLLLLGTHSMDGQAVFPILRYVYSCGDTRGDRCALSWVPPAPNR